MASDLLCFVRGAIDLDIVTVTAECSLGHVLLVVHLNI